MEDTCDGEETISYQSTSSTVWHRSLDEEIQELDDTEFGIPPIEVPPTLESILYDTDSGSVSEDEANPVGLFHETADSASISSTASLDSKGRRYDRSARSRRSPARHIHGSILRQFILRGVATQLVSAAERVHTGMPTAMAVSSVIAIGTSHGIVLVFDVKQTLKWCLGSTSTGDQYGSVSSLGFNCNCTRLLCGFAKGQITMWDVTSGKLLRTITDAHPPGTAVLHIQFTDDPTLAVCSDSGGSVFELNFKRVMAVRSCDSKCIFSGSRGEVCAIQILNMMHVKEHPLQEVCIIAMATLSKASPTTLPMLFWQFVVIQVSSEERVVDPVLSFGRESLIYFFQVASSSKDRIQFLPLQKMELEYVCSNFLWVNSRTIVVMDNSEHLHIVDVRTREELEVLDLANVQLVYSSSYFKGLATGGNVSKAMALAGERSCYQSMASYSGQLLLLGTKSVHVMTLRTWSERIDQLARQHRYPEALALALSFYEDRAKAVVGLVNKKERKKAILADKILELLYSFVEFTLATIPENTRPDVLEEHFLDAIPLCIEYCIILDKRDLIFGKLYETFSVDSTGHTIFLESLEQHILNDSLASISPTVLREFVKHYEAKDLFQELENCIIHLNIENLDLHKVITLCWEHNLYNAIIYIYTKGMADYTTPFQELMSILQKEINLGMPLTSDVISLGNRLLVYTSCCLAGRAYPLGNIPPEQKSMVKTEMFRCLTLLHTRNAPDDEPPYPYLRTFLHFDTRELLNVLALAFEEPEFTKDAGLFQRQRLVDILLQIMIDGRGFTPSQVGALFTFLARQLAKPNNAIVVNRSLFEQVLEYLTNADDDCRHAERQQAILELLNAGGLKHYDEERLLHLSYKAKLFQVSEVLYEKRREFHKILSCYVHDSTRKANVFSFVEKHLLNSELTTDEKKLLQLEVITKIGDIVSVDQQQTVQLIANCFPERFFEIVQGLKDVPEAQYSLLKGLFECRDSNATTSLQEIVCENSSLQEKYIELMCRYSAHEVSGYIKSADRFRVEIVLQIVQEYCIREAVALLLEKMGDIQGAFSILLEDFQKSIHQFCHAIPDGSATAIESNVDTTKTSLSAVIQFCQRNSFKVDENEREALWFPLLETLLLQLQKHGPVVRASQNTFKELTDCLLNNMIGYIKLPSVLQRIIQDPSYQKYSFGEMKELLLGMLETYNYEMTLLSTTRNLVNVDLHQQLTQLKQMANRAYSMHANSCDSCSRPVDHSSCDNEVVIFRCGHKYHKSCMTSSPLAQKEDTDGSWLCILCYQRKRQSPLTETRVTIATSSHKCITSPDCQNGIPTPRRNGKLNTLEEMKSCGILGVPKNWGRLQNEPLKLQLSPPHDKPLPDYA